MVRIDVDYAGDLHCEVTHVPSGQKFLTDAPVDNKGKGEHISPTDLLCASIASCVATIMGIKADGAGIDIMGLRISAFKEMTDIPVRRVGKLTLDITFPRQLDSREFDLLSNVVRTCPVTRSLSAEVALEYKFSFGEGTVSPAQ